MSGKIGPYVYTSGSILNLDILNKDSYTSGSLYWYDLIGGASGSFTNTSYSGEAPIRFILTSSLSSTIQITGSAFDYTRTDKTYSFWFNGREKNKVIFDKGRNFWIFLTTEGRALVGLKSTAQAYTSPTAMYSLDGYLYVAFGGSNNHVSLKVYYTSSLDLHRDIWAESGISFLPFIYFNGMSASGSSIILSDLSDVYVVNAQSFRNDIMPVTSSYAFNGTYGANTSPTSSVINYAFGTAVDNTHVYIPDRYNNFIKKFIKGTTTYVTHSVMSSQNHMVADTDYLYVARSNNTIIKLNKSDLTTVWSSGSTGAGNNQFSSPVNVAVDSTYLYVADSGNSRITKHNKSDMSWVSSTGSSSTTSLYYLTGIAQIAVDDNYLYAASTSFLKQFDKNTLQFITSQSYMAVADASNIQYGMKCGRFFPNSDIIYWHDRGGYVFKTQMLSDGNYRYLSRTGSLTHGADNYGIAFDDQYMYLTGDSQKVVKYNRTNFAYVTHSGAGLGSTTDLYSYPKKLAIDDNYVYVTDTNNHRIKKLNKSDLSLSLITGSNSGTTHNLVSCVGLYLSSSNLYVATNNRIKVYNTSDFSYITESAAVFSVYDITADDDFIYGANSYILYKINKSTLTQVAVKSLTQNTLPGDYADGIAGIEIDDKYIYLANSMTRTTFLKSDLSYVNTISFYTKTLSSGILNNGWNNITLSISSAGVVKLYSNGVFNFQYSMGTFEIKNSEPLNIGYSKYHNQYITSDVSNIIVYDRVLSDSEISQNYSALKNRYNL